MIILPSPCRATRLKMQAFNSLCIFANCCCDSTTTTTKQLSALEKKLHCENEAKASKVGGLLSIFAIIIKHFPNVDDGNYR